MIDKNRPFFNWFSTPYATIDNCVFRKGPWHRCQVASLSGGIVVGRHRCQDL